VYEHQAAFMHALRDGRAMRERIFDTIEQHHADDLETAGSGRVFMKTCFRLFAIQGCLKLRRSSKRGFFHISIQFEQAASQTRRKIAGTLVGAWQQSYV
jgi:hypothetical protein